MKTLILVIAAIISANAEKRFIYPIGGGGGPGSFGGGSTNYHPCTPQQSHCDLNCPSGYLKGPMGCDFCQCSHDHVTPGSVLTDPTSHVTTARTTAAPTAAPSTTVDICNTAHALCTNKCGAGGFLVDPDDCTFCVCKQQSG
ncbi:uncharacterized protein LOC127865597 [Dreissena polymorpha]|uniref:Antistasin-like domain-containing protein n=1 Tax=Dreissena polymorpha TaxID=45954 RepID=A0A9D4LLB6_DREPO|nr:uncharacterized protein LOC127865597 [Dreissena polymorpha]KAH3860125.1 hypothetical protein DPMN_023016 [Dreissena polymorpha]